MAEHADGPRCRPCRDDGLSGAKLTSGLQGRLKMTESAEYVARENIRRFKEQLLVAPEGARRTTICELLSNEKNLLHNLVAGRS